MMASFLKPHEHTCASIKLFNLYAEYIMRNTKLDKAEAGIKIAGKNINNLRYTDDGTLMVEIEEGITSLHSSHMLVK